MTRERHRLNGATRPMAAFAAAVMLAAPAATVFPGQARAQTASAPYRLAPGDRISVVVLGQTELSGDVLVSDGGGVGLPLLGAIDLRDRTPLEAEKLITGQLSQGYLERPIVTVRIVEFRPVYVMGGVRTPGSYPFRYG
ncbi:polysaccharide biosynthesis/export family protein, partial [Hansschlegelia zhihuaiae]